MNAKHVWISIAGFALIGCATAGKINRISVGMSKEEVMELMGRPTSTSAKDGVEYLNYALSETGDDAFYGKTDPYFVRVINGRVDAYGRHGDFDSAKESTQVIKIQSESKSDDKITVKTAENIEEKLVKLKSLFEKGLITKEEYESKKSQILEGFATQ